MKDIVELFLNEGLQVLPVIFDEKSLADELSSSVLNLTYSKHLTIKF